MDAPRAAVVVAACARARVGSCVGAWTRIACAALALSLLVTTSAQAQRRILPASKPPPPCVQVRIGSDEAGRWDCINDAIKSEVDKVAPVNAADSPGERLAPTGQGLAVPAATRQRLGDQYGKSIVPQRPERHFPATPLSRPPGH